ncbi:putative lipoprotein LprH [Mycobacterium ulcerans str. Harvey]|uniref:Lipoprotein LprH n=1 Tax=Mycobacterium ulcerans str. Harvey TaxID=1299332 RepID=A0ABP3AV59_MYCUL|nr:putative lipoprotein LprH [Mycobacterium ulcerans str. Harvey]
MPWRCICRYPAGEFGPITLKSFGTPAEGVLVWSMGRSDWNCDYGLAVVPRAALVISACDKIPDFRWRNGRSPDGRSSTTGSDTSRGSVAIGC